MPSHGTAETNLRAATTMEDMDPNLIPPEAMDQAMDLFNHPVLLVIVGVLTVVSTIWSIQGLRRKDVPLFILGIAAGIPTFAVTSWKTWAVGGLVAAFAFWLRNKIERV